MASAIITAVLIVVAFVMTVVAFRHYHESQRTQAAGVVEARVVTAQTHVHRGRYSTSYTASYGAMTAAGGMVTIHVRGHANPDMVGRGELVKVDPQNSGYAEFPGYPFTSHSTEYVAFGFLLVVSLAEVLFITAWRRKRSASRLL